MKININVLPDAQKEKRSQERRIGKILRIGLSLILVLVLFNVSLFMFQTILGIEFQATKKSSEYSLGRKAGENKSEKVFRETGVQVATLSKINSEIPRWSRVMKKMTEICPAEIRLSRISIEENKMKISGFSKTREAFLFFEERMKAESFEAPSDISNLVASHDFNFDLEITVPTDYLNQK